LWKIIIFSLYKIKYKIVEPFFFVNQAQQIYDFLKVLAAALQKGQGGYQPNQAKIFISHKWETAHYIDGRYQSFR
jgi:hypothetical protein